MQTKKCLNCKEIFSKPINESKKNWNNRHKYCSKKCYIESMKGRKNPKLITYKKGYIPWIKGRDMPKGKDNKQYTSIEKICEICGKLFKVKSYRKDTARFCSHKCGYIDRDDGKSTENRRIRDSIEYDLWRNSVFSRDNWRCKKCLKSGGVLCSHHIKNFSDYHELRFAVDNGITLCEGCHKLFHKTYGFRKNSDAQIYEFLESVDEA